MAVALNVKQEDSVIDMLTASVPSAEGVVSETGENVRKVAEITKTIVGKMRVAGFSFGDILSVIAMIGYFVAQHGDDIEAIWKAILAIFGRTV